MDLVIFSFGHTEKADQIADDLQALWDKLPAGSMGLVIAQNPQGGEGADGQRERVRAVTGWAQANDVASVNVYEAFTTHTEPLPRLLRGDGITPSDQGSEVWSEAVIATLT